MMTTTKESVREANAIAVDAYIYLHPLVLMEMTRRQMTNLPGGVRPGFGPMGAFAHVREFPPADFRAVVRPNFDTLYSVAWLDLGDEPMVVSAPDTDGRYYLLPMYDMWTDVFAAPGKRTTGTEASHVAVALAGWRGDLPDGVQRIDATTPYVWIVGRTQTNGPADYDAVHRVQDGFAVTPLSRWPQAPEPAPATADPSVDMDTDPLAQVAAMPAADYFTLGAELMRMHPPHVTDWSILQRMRRIGLRAGEALDVAGLDPQAVAALEAAPAEATAVMDATTPRLAKVINGWEMNTDSMGVYGNFYLKRAIVARIGLGANQPEDAIYPLNLADAEGRPLDGDHDYVLHFAADELPPVDAFWSVTMYDAEGYQTANALNRFAIGDRDPLVYNADGSLDLLLSHESPGADHEANWLPAPRGPLGVTLRLYAPRGEALDGRWNPPAIRRVDGKR